MTAVPALTNRPTWTARAWSCDVRLVVTDPSALRPAARDLDHILTRVDAAASRFRPDSALSVANARAGKPVPVPHLLVDLLTAALDAAARTDGAVDPTLGLAMQALGYDRTFADITGAVATRAVPPTAARRAVRLHREAGLLTVPRGTALDLGATAKAWTADHAAHTLAARYGTAVLVEIGGDLAVAGDAPDGWRVRVAERAGAGGQVVLLHRGGLATSTTTVRTWRRGAESVHHIVDPATGRPADGPWRTASVAAGSALAANTASTAAIVMGERAVEWLTAQGHAARLVARDGAVTTVGAWPARAATGAAA